jgi:hypothetical protein
MQVYLMAVNPRLAFKQPQTQPVAAGAINRGKTDALDEMVSVYSYRSIDAAGSLLHKAAGSLRNLLKRH